MRPKNATRKYGAAFLSRSAILLEYLSLKLARGAHKLTAQPYKRNLLTEIDEYSRSADEFIKDPTKLADTVRQPEYKAVVKYYFLMKRAVAQAEAYDKTVSLQLANEMRNALDHMMRSLISYEDEAGAANNSERNLSRMKGHLQRGILDAMKITCAHLDEDIDRRHARFSDKAIGLVNNGEYVKNINAMHVDAKGSFVKAREDDFQLGTEIGDRDVISNYLKAVVAYKAAHDYQSRNYRHLIWAQSKLVMYVALGALGLFTATVVAEFFRISVAGSVADAIRDLF